MARTKDEVLDLIRKLLAMTTERGCTEAEAANAAAKAQALLQEYKLEMAEVGTASESVEPDMRKSTLDVKGKGHDGSWKAMLLFRIARYNFCRAVELAGTDRSLLFGAATDVEVVTMLFNWIVEQLERFATDMWKEYDGIDRRPTWRRSFFTAAVTAVGNRLYQQQQEFEKSSEKSTALVVASKEAVDKYVSDTLGPLGHARPRGSSGSMSGSLAGTVAGHMVNLDKPYKRLADGG